MQGIPNHYRMFWISVLSTLVLTSLLALASCRPMADIGMSDTDTDTEQTAGTPTPTPIPPTPTATPPPTPTPLPRGGSLTIRMTQDIPQLQPWQPRSREEEQVSSLLYNGLMRLDDTLRPQPDLAERWDASADGRTLTFTIRNDVTWHDGQPLDAIDVHFTLDRMRALPFTSTALLADLQKIAGIATPDRYTVVLSLTERYAPLLSELTLPILPHHLLEDRDIGSTNFWDTPIGTGPFVFERRDRGESVVLSRNDYYFRGAPMLERVAFVGSPDPDVTVQALRENHLMLAELPWQTIQRVSDTLTNFTIESYPENGFYFLGFNVREGSPFADVNTRRALALALDIPLLVETMTNGTGMPIGSSASPGSWADLTPPPSEPADLDAARTLLADAGWELPPGGTIRQRDGKPFRARLFVRNDDERRLATAQHIAEVGARIGLDIVVEPADFSTGIISKYAPPYDFDLLLGSWINGAGARDFPDYAYYDPDDFLLFHSSQINQGIIDTRITRNFVGFHDPAYDNQSLVARQLYDIEARIAAYQQTQAIIARSLPYLYLWTDRIGVVLNNNVTTLDGPVNLATPNYLWNIERWHLKDR